MQLWRVTRQSYILGEYQPHRVGLMHIDPLGEYQPHRVGIIHECSTGEMLARVAFMHQHDQGHNVFKHQEVLKALTMTPLTIPVLYCRYQWLQC